MPMCFHTDPGPRAGGSGWSDWIAFDRTIINIDAASSIEVDIPRKQPARFGFDPDEQRLLDGFDPEEQRLLDDAPQLDG